MARRRNYPSGVEHCKRGSHVCEKHVQKSITDSEDLRNPEEHAFLEKQAIHSQVEQEREDVVKEEDPGDDAVQDRNTSLRTLVSNL